MISRFFRISNHTKRALAWIAGRFDFKADVNGQASTLRVPTLEAHGQLPVQGGCGG